ncbi:unnamed protein product [Acanthosepion pharaonis]|uniref:Uncharacterized protein n=1 Tax=Acanthosepion pharaonis TaxID=158019 RepID=A0A812BB58_ACAPH|nr:unnamed protein product [Sepia pharaonis]
MNTELLGCPSNFLSRVNQLYKDQRGQVGLDSDLSGPFSIVNGLKQNCFLALTLFSIFFSMMLKQATENLDDGDAVYNRNSLGDSLFNLRRLQAHTKTLEQLFRDLLFVDNTALVDQVKRALQRLTPCIVEAARLFRFEVRPRSFTSLHPEESTAPPTPPLARLS